MSTSVHRTAESEAIVRMKGMAFFYLIGDDREGLYIGGSQYLEFILANKKTTKEVDSGSRIREIREFEIRHGGVWGKYKEYHDNGRYTL